MVNFIIADLKREYRSLLRKIKNVLIFSTSTLKINPLEVPEWIGISEWIVFFAKVFTRENYLLGTSENVLIETLQYIYRARGIYEGSKDWPTPIDLYRVIEKRLETEKSFRYRDILLWIRNRLYPYTLCEVFDCRTDIPERIWFNKNVILELDEGFTDNMYNFTVSYLVGLRYLYNKKHALVGSILRTLFIIDEGRILFNANRNFRDFGESYINEIITKTREYGIGFIIASQESTSFNQTVRSISYTKIAFPLTDGTDLKFIKESFGLDEEQSAYLFKLPPYVAVVRYGGYKEPFLLGVPFTDLGPPVSDEEVAEHMKPYLGAIMNEIQLPTPIRQVNQGESIPSYAAALLHFLGKNPFTKVSEMTGAPGFSSPADVARALSWLEDNGYVMREAYRVSKRGRKAVFAVLTQKAFSYLGLRPIVGKGSFEHQLYQHIISQALKRDGLDARIEGRTQGSEKLIDVLVGSESGGYVAYEITIHFENLVSNIQKDFEAGVSQVVIVCMDAKGLEKAKTIVDADASINQSRDRIGFSLISDFFP